mmetsp:Transcript_21033/g.48647  ORF Transcript_21033/g.48647 Transcript_21033/m.48647 type:complete len:312 (+) Transcript_21033:3-938(+)
MRESTRARQLLVRKALLKGHGTETLDTIDSIHTGKLSSGSGSRWTQMLSRTFDSEIPEEGETLPANFARVTSGVGKNMLKREISMARNMDELEGKLRMSAMTNDHTNLLVLNGELGAVDWTSPVRCLDQLFAQAAGLDIILKGAVQRWALASDGLFPVKDRPKAYVAWKDAVVDMALARTIKWGKLKSPERAIEKAFRSCKGDVSRILDLARQTIVFRSVHSLLECLGVIHADPDVIVERVKNRMDPDFDTKLSAGYRDVSLNLRIQNGATQSMGIETHVCEVQLLLTQFADLKNDNGHSRYVTWRNTRGE